MESIFEDFVPTETLSVIEKRYHQEVNDSKVTIKTTFEYAVCLVKSQFLSDVKKGIKLMEELFVKSPDHRRDCLYYLAIGEYRLNNFSKSKHYIREFLAIEPTNKQIIDLDALVQKKLDDMGFKGMLIAGAAAVAVGTAVTAGLALLSRRS